MSGLVGYGSSDEEDEIESERPAKITKIEANSSATPPAPTHRTDSTPPTRTASSPTEQQSAPLSISQPDPPPAISAPSSVNAHLSSQPAGPTYAPAPAAPEETNTSTPSSPPQSPYTASRQRLHALTMPTVPTFDIPPSPPRDSDPDAVAALAASTKKFTRFLELKGKGVHFNARLQSSSSLRNPSLLPKLMEFAGVSKEDSYASTLEEDVGGVPVKWGEDCYVEELVRSNDAWRKRRAKEREKVEFVAEKGSRGSSAAGSAVGTPTGKGGEGKKRSRFDR